MMELAEASCPGQRVLEVLLRGDAESQVLATSARDIMDSQVHTLLGTLQLLLKK